MHAVQISSHEESSVDTQHHHGRLWATRSTTTDFHEDVKWLVVNGGLVIAAFCVAQLIADIVMVQKNVHWRSQLGNNRS